MEECYKANFEVRISRETNLLLDLTATKRGILKREAIAEAIQEYVEKYNGNLLAETEKQ